MTQNIYNRLLNKMSLMLNDNSGIAFGIAILGMLLIVGTASFLALTPAVNEFAAMFNDQVAAGDVSEQRGNSTAWAFVVWNAIPIFMLLGCLAWGIVRALEQKNTEGT